MRVEFSPEWKRNKLFLVVLEITTDHGANSYFLLFSAPIISMKVDPEVALLF